MKLSINTVTKKIKLWMLYSIAYILKTKPEFDSARIKFNTTDSTRICLVYVIYLAIIGLLVIAGIVQQFGIYHQIWTVLLLFMALGFDGLSPSEDEFAEFELHKKKIKNKGDEGDGDKEELSE